MSRFRLRVCFEVPFEGDFPEGFVNTFIYVEGFFPNSFVRLNIILFLFTVPHKP